MRVKTTKPDPGSTPEQSIRLTINGQPRTFQGNPSLETVLDVLGANRKHVALVLNNAVLPRDRWSDAAVKDGDSLDILVMAGGG